MSTVGVSAGGPTSQADWEAIVQESSRLVEQLAWSRKIRRLLLLGFLVFVALTAWMFYQLIQRIRSPQNIEEITRLAQAKLADNSERYQKEVQLLVEQATPVITDAFYKQAKQDLPQFMHKAGEQRDLLVTNLQDRLTKRMDEHYRTILDRHEAILVEELPSAKDPQVRERLRTNLGLVFDRMVQRHYGDEMKDQLVTLYDGWDHFPAAPAPTGPDDPPLEDQFIGTLLELLTQKLTQQQGGLVASSETTVPAVAPVAPRQRSQEDREAEATQTAEPAPAPAEPEKTKSDESNP
jgi:hypothetical protein